MKRNLRFYSMVLALVLVMGMFAACGGNGATTSPGSSAGGSASMPGSDAPASYEGVTIRAMMQGHPSTYALQEMVPEFEEMTGMKVELEVVPYDELVPKSLLTLSNKDPSYDIIFSYNTYLSSFASNGYLWSLDEFVQNPDLNKYVDLDDFVEGYLNTCKYEDALYGFPMYGESTFLMYRQDLFEQYDIQPPQTMADLMDAAKAVKEASNGETYGITMRAQKGVQAVFIWSSFLHAFGGEWFNEDGRLMTDSPEAIEAAQFFADILNDYGPPGVANFGWDENRLAFTNGSTAITLDATTNGAYNEDPNESQVVGKVGYISTPLAPGVDPQGTSALAVHSLMINKASANPEAAFLFASWASNKEQQIRGLEIEPHCSVTSLAAMDSDIFNTKYGAFKEAMLAAIENGSPDYMPTNADANEVIEKIGTALSEIMVGNKDAATVMTEATADINTNVLGK